MRERQEREADEFASYFLIPDEELRNLTGKEIKELTEYFGVPQEKVRLRLMTFDVDK